MRVKDIKIRKVLASNADFTVEVEIETEKFKVFSSVPIGTSKGKYEAKILDLKKVFSNFLFVRRFFKEKEFSELVEIDDLLRSIDRTENFSKLGANLALAISSAFLKAFSKEASKEIYQYVAEEFRTKAKIPKPICNVIGGGKHGGSIDFQEFLLLPIHQEKFVESIKVISKIYRKIGNRLKELDKTFRFGRNLESAWITSLSLFEVLDLLKEFCNENLKIGIDIAASSFWDGKSYFYKNLGKRLTSQQQLSFIREIAENYPVYYLEDPFHEDDFVSFSALTSLLPNKLICGDDLLVTNLKRLRDAAEMKAVNCAIIKPNQVGTITDTINFFKFAKRKNIVTVFSHRSSQSDDILFSHLAVGLGCDYVKFGIAGERIIKINEIIRIEESFKEIA